MADDLQCSVAMEQRNVFVEPRLLLAILDLPQLDPPAPREGWLARAWLDSALKQMKLKPLDGAYVMVWKAGTDEITVARTSPIGELVVIVEAEIASAVPSSAPERHCWFEPGAAYEYFWTSERAIFELALADRRKDRRVFDAHHGCFPFVNRPSRLFDGDERLHFGLDGIANKRLGWLLEAIEMDEPAGYLTDEDRRRVHFNPGLAKGRYLLARRPALDALRVAELLIGGYLDIRHQAVRIESTFGLAASLADDGETGRLIDGDAELCARAPVNAEYIAYARRCADAGVDRALFYEAIPSPSLRNAPWYFAGKKIAEDHPSVGEHPGAHRTYDVVDVDRIKRHFDLRRFALDHGQNRLWRAHARNVQILLTKQTDEVRGGVRAFVLRFARWPGMLRDLGARTPGCSPDDRDDLHLRYVSMMAALDEQLAVQLPENVETLGPYSGWIATMMDKGGGSFDFLLNDVHTYFTRPALKNAPEVLRRELKNILRLARASNVPEVDWKLNFATKMHVDVQTGTIEVSGPFGRKVGELEFRARADWMKSKYWHPKVLNRMVKDAQSVDLVKESSVPKVIGAAGSAIGLGLSVATLADDLRTKDDVLVVGRVSQNVVQTIDSLSSASTFVRRHLTTILGETALTALKPVGAGLEGAFNLHEGTTLIVVSDGENEGAARELTYWKGVVLIGTGAAAVAAVGIGAGAAAGAALGAAAFVGVAAPMFAVAGMIVAGGALVVLAIDVTKYFVDGPSGSLGWLEDELKAACKDEYGANLLARGAAIGEMKYTHSRTWERGEAFLRDMKRALQTVG